MWERGGRAPRILDVTSRTLRQLYAIDRFRVMHWTCSWQGPASGLGPVDERRICAPVGNQTPVPPYSSLYHCHWDSYVRPLLSFRDFSNVTQPGLSLCYFSSDINRIGYFRESIAWIFNIYIIYLSSYHQSLCNLSTYYVSTYTFIHQYTHRVKYLHLIQPTLRSKA